MLEDFAQRPTPGGDRRHGRHEAVDGLIAGRNEVWLLMARPGDDPQEMLWSGEATLCREVLDHGVLVIGSVDPDNDPLLSELLRGEDRGTA